MHGQYEGTRKMVELFTKQILHVVFVVEWLLPKPTFAPYSFKYERTNVCMSHVHRRCMAKRGPDLNAANLNS